MVGVFSSAREVLQGGSAMGGECGRGSAAPAPEVRRIKGSRPSGRRHDPSGEGDLGAVVYGAQVPW